MNRLFARPAALVFVFVSILGLAACGGDPAGTGSGGGGAAAAAPITLDVLAAKGGIVADPDKTVSLAIPANALAADTKITLTVTPKEDPTVTSVYTFGPAGVMLTTPATLLISTDGISIPAKMKAVMATKSGSTWAEVPGTQETSGAVQVSVTTLAAYSVILVAAPQCAESCLSQPGAVCCMACGCQAMVSCPPVCGSGTMWDCEMGCCFDSTALKCAP
ncbi:MAG: hypothetical protein ABJE95_06175 [Byssovorax sp.]